jgi:pimeloyl-ACP methyl ester carboxylesterase
MAIKISTFLLLILCFDYSNAQPIRKTSETIYLFPGQGSDSNIFKSFSLKKNYQVRRINYPIPPRNCNLKNYSKIISTQIDTTEPFILIGVSLGGMICTELTDILKPKKVVIISSAKCRAELPLKYRFQKYIPFNRIVPKSIVKWAAIKLQPRVEPDSKNKRAIFEGMLKSKNKKFLKRSVNMVINWNRKTYSSAIIHIHGALDHTLPIKNIKANYIVKNGSHMMMLTRGEEISEIISKEIGE